MTRRRLLPARAALLAAALVSAGFLAGCSKLSDYGALIRGNRLHERGRYQEAAAAYLSARPFAFGPVLDYDLANVYARLGELDAAAELYAEARKAGDSSLSAAAFYNEGLALYEKARYEESYRAFRASLALDPGDGEARRNLEIAYRDWRKSDLAPPERAAPSARSRGDGDEELRLLRRLETGRYKPGAASAGAPRLEDY